MRTTTTNNVIIPDEVIRHVAPSVFGLGQDSKRTSDAYQFYPTSEVMNGLRASGYEVTSVMEQRVRANGGEERYQRDTRKHCLRFALRDDIGERFSRESDDPTRPEIVLINAHNGTSSYRLMAGVFRLVCANGMVIADTLFNEIRIRHLSTSPDDVIAASLRIAREAPTVMASIDAMRGIQLDENKRGELIERCAIARFGEDYTDKVIPRTLMRTWRCEDAEDKSLWRTFNILQENLTKGGTRTLERHNHRAIKGIDSNTKLNKELWDIAYSYLPN
ncbi:MAG: DUF932 domain-containing protein [Tannerellaceae bacterium]